MGEAGTTADVTPEEVLSVFETLHRGEPLSSVDISEALGCTRRTAYNRLQTLESRGDLRTKKVGARARVWWRAAPMDLIDQPRQADTETETATERVIEIELRSEQLAEAFEEVTPPDGSLRFDVEHDVSLPDGRTLQYYTVSGVSPRAFAKVFDEFPSMEHVRLLSTVDETSRFEGIVARHSVSEVLRRHDGQTVSAGVRDGEHWVVARLPESADVSVMTTDIQEVYPDMTLWSIRYAPTVQNFWSMLADELTERQQTVLQFAYYAGYFERPRLTTGEELADRLGITRQTFNYHLKQAEHTVFRWLFQEGSMTNADP